MVRCGSRHLGQGAQYFLPDGARKSVRRLLCLRQVLDMNHRQVTDRHDILVQGDLGPALALAEYQGLAEDHHWLYRRRALDRSMKGRCPELAHRCGRLRARAFRKKNDVVTLGKALTAGGNNTLAGTGGAIHALNVTTDLNKG